MSCSRPVRIPAKWLATTCVIYVRSRSAQWWQSGSCGDRGPTACSEIVHVSGLPPSHWGCLWRDHTGWPQRTLLKAIPRRHQLPMGQPNTAVRRGARSAGTGQPVPEIPERRGRPRLRPRSPTRWKHPWSRGRVPHPLRRRSPVGNRVQRADDHRRTPALAGRPLPQHCRPNRWFPLRRPSRWPHQTRIALPSLQRRRMSLYPKLLR